MDEILPSMGLEDIARAAAMEVSRARRHRGAVFTPRVLADWVATELALLLRRSGCRSGWILDPACGDGELLAAVRRTTGGRFGLAGLEIEASTASSARMRLGPTADLTLADALVDDWQGSHAPVAVIANPPWGADMPHTPVQLRRKGYSLAAGQFDVYELFVERALRELPTGAPAAFIIPDSIFLPEHEPLRRMLIENARLMTLARLGEGFFPGVYRSAVVLLFRVGRPRQGHKVRCLQLTGELRKSVLSGAVSLAHAAESAAHQVPQERFASNARSNFDISFPEDDRSVLRHFDVERFPWREWLKSGRGVELGSSGLVLVCPSCRWARPLPREGKAVKCSGCGTRISANDGILESIIKERTGKRDRNWAPLITGRDVNRYVCRPRLQIKLDVPGVAYKHPGDYAPRKLLVRKTGIGIKSAIDGSGAYTNQVVFHFTARPEAPEFVLDYLQGILGSRVLLAFYLQASGEKGWRSHPYVTPTVLRDLPIPHPGKSGARSWRQAEAIAAAVKRHTTASASDPHDLHIEGLVAGMYGLSRSGCQWVATTLEDAEPLESIRTLRLGPHDKLAPVLVR